MSISNIVLALLECENDQRQCLVDLMSLLESSRAQAKHSHIVLMVRGLHTQNTNLLGLLQVCAQDLDNNVATPIDTFKLFVSEFIMWFASAAVAFEKYQKCFPVEGDDNASFEKALVHCGCYPAFIDSAMSVIRNPFVVDRLTKCKSRSLIILENYASHMDEVKNIDIRFDQTRAIGGHSVSCFFTVDQIVDRTKDIKLCLGEQKVELLLLNLQEEKKKQAYNAMAVVSVDACGRHLLLYPPFRLNELSMTLDNDTITFTTVTLYDSPESFSVHGKESLMASWYSKLECIFPATATLVSSEDITFNGLGITISGHSDPEPSTPVASQDLNYEGLGITISGQSDPEPKTPVSNVLKSPVVSYDSQQSSLKIMKKNLSNGSISSVSKIPRPVVKEAQNCASAKAEYDYSCDAESIVESMDEIGFEIVNTTKAINTAKLEQAHPASLSLPDLSAPVKPVYRNAAGSAIDIHNFGRDHNPLFGSTDDLPKQTKLQQRTRSSSIFSIFRKNKSGNGLEANEKKDAKIKSKAVSKEKTKNAKTEEKVNLQAKNVKDKTTAKGSMHETKSKLSTKISQRPELSIEVPKIAVANRSQPLSATSSKFSSTLPLPFALPLSTSTHFFKSPTSGTSDNKSSSSLVDPDSKESLNIPNDLKEIINSDDSVDFYITPTSPKALTVSRWKQKYGKWEMLTTNENIFIKIVANYGLHKSWMLVFKEEYDEEYKEVVDKPVLILDIDTNAEIRQSSALDLQIHAVNSVTKEKMLVIVRCNNSMRYTELKLNLENIHATMISRMPHSTTFESNSTISSSLMSGKPSTSSTLTSICSMAHDKSTPTSVNYMPNDEVIHEEEMVLLDRTRIRLHKQQESYEKIHQLSSWKTITMYSLNVFHSCSDADKASYHLHLDCRDDSVDEEMRHFRWTIDEDHVADHIEPIGKAAFLVKMDDDIFMLECKGKKEFRRLYGLF